MCPRALGGWVIPSEQERGDRYRRSDTYKGTHLKWQSGEYCNFVLTDAWYLMVCAGRNGRGAGELGEVAGDGNFTLGEKRRQGALGTLPSRGNPTSVYASFVRNLCSKSLLGNLLFVAVQAVDGSDGAEKAVRFALNACGEK